MKKVLLTFLGLIILAAVFYSGFWYARHGKKIPPTSPPNFAGVYKCRGYDPYLDKDYTGTVTVTQQNTVYRLEMDYDTDEKASGTGGMYDTNDMSVVFQDHNNLKIIGLERYKFSPDLKTMSGYWVYLGEDKLGREICDRQ